MLQYLQEKPQIGIASGTGAGLLYKVQYLLTNEEILKIVSGMAQWLGCMVAALTFFAWLIKIYQSLKPKKS